MDESMFCGIDPRKLEAVAIWPKDLGLFSDGQMASLAEI